MDEVINEATTGCINITLALLSLGPLILLSPLIRFHGSPALRYIWNVWFALLVSGLWRLLNFGDTLHADWTHQRAIQRRQQLADQRAREAAENGNIVLPPLSEPATPSTPQSERPILTPVTPRSSISRTASSSSSLQFIQPAQMPDPSRRPSIQDEHDHALRMASTFAAHIRDSDKDYAYVHDMSPGGASRLGSRRPSMASGSATPRIFASGNATPRIARSRAGSFNFSILAAFDNSSSTNLGGPVSFESSKRHKRTHTEG